MRVASFNSHVDFQPLIMKMIPCLHPLHANAGHLVPLTSRRHAWNTRSEKKLQAACMGEGRGTYHLPTCALIRTLLSLLVPASASCGATRPSCPAPPHPRPPFPRTHTFNTPNSSHSNQPGAPRRTRMSLAAPARGVGWCCCDARRVPGACPALSHGHTLRRAQHAQYTLEGREMMHSLSLAVRLLLRASACGVCALTSPPRCGDLRRRRALGGGGAIAWIPMHRSTHSFVRSIVFIPHPPSSLHAFDSFSPPLRLAVGGAGSRGAGGAPSPRRMSLRQTVRNGVPLRHSHAKMRRRRHVLPSVQHAEWRNMRHPRWHLCHHRSADLHGVQQRVVRAQFSGSQSNLSTASFRRRFARSLHAFLPMQSERHGDEFLRCPWRVCRMRTRVSSAARTHQ